MIYITCFIMKEKKLLCSIFTVFVLGYLSAAMFFFLAYFLTVFWKGASYFFDTKCSILDVAGVLNRPQYAPTWIAYIFKCLTKDNTGLGMMHRQYPAPMLSPAQIKKNKACAGDEKLALR